MDQTIPNTPATQTSTDGGETARIGVALVTFPMPWNMMGSCVFYNALCAGLSRDGIGPVNSKWGFKDTWTVAMFDVASAARNSAIASIKRTLDELLFLDLAKIAIHTAEETWLTVHGLGAGGIEFGDLYVNSDFGMANRAELEKAKAAMKEMMDPANIENTRAEYRSASEGKKPDSGK